MHSPLQCDYFEGLLAVLSYSARFEGRERLRWWFDNPNYCGAFLAAMIVLVVAGLACSKVRAASGGKKGTLWIVACGAMAALTLTYSRGAGLAAFAGMAVLYILLPKGRSAIFYASGIQAMVWLVVPHAFSRYLHLRSGDLSVLHRLQLWRDTAVLIWDHPWKGVPASQFGPFLNLWYQHFNSSFVYPDPLNTVLWLAAAKGLPAATAAICFATFVLVTAGLLARSQSNSRIAALVAAECCLVVAGLFSPTVRSTTIAILELVLFLALLAELARWLYLNPGDVRYVSVTAIGSMGLVAVTVLGCTYSLATTSRPDHPVAGVSTTRVGPYHAWVLRTRATPGLSPIIIIDGEYGVEAMSRGLIRRLSAVGFPVVYIYAPAENQDPGGGSNLPPSIINATASLSRPPLVLAVGEWGRRALLHQGELGSVQAVVTIGAPGDWIEDALSPLKHVGEFSCPVLLLHGEKDTLFPCSEARELARAANALRKNVICRIAPDTGHDFAHAWDWATDAIVGFIETRQVLGKFQ